MSAENISKFTLCSSWNGQRISTYAVVKNAFKLKISSRENCANLWQVKNCYFRGASELHRSVNLDFNWSPKYIFLVSRLSIRQYTIALLIYIASLMQSLHLRIFISLFNPQILNLFRVTPTKLGDFILILGNEKIWTFIRMNGNTFDLRHLAITSTYKYFLVSLHEVEMNIRKTV